MEEIKFNRKDEASFYLKKSEDMIAVRTHSKKPIGTTMQSEHSIDCTNDCECVMEFPNAGLEVYRIPAGRDSLSSRKQTLRMLPDVRFAGTVLVDPTTDEPVIYSENIFIQFIESLDTTECLEIIAASQLVVKEALDYAPNAYFVKANEGSGTHIFQMAMNLLNREEVQYCHPEILRQRRNRAIHRNQWHLKKTTVTYETEVDASANVEAAHRLSEGEGITIAIIDDGFDIDHPEFSGVDKIVAPKNIGGYKSSDDPRPRTPRESHGTAAAGVACANGNYGASGVAPKARLMPIRLYAPLGSIKEAHAFIWAASNGADIISCSWGPGDGEWTVPSDPRHDQVFPLPASTRLAIDYAVKMGRNGKGCPVFFAAGNGNESVDNDGYASYRNVIAVAACNDHNRRSAYSDFGKALWCAFPSSDIWHPDPNFKPRGSQPLTRGIWTTDLLGNAGDNKASIHSGDAWGNYTNAFGGTSSACPGAAGVAALVLSVNPALSWHEVRDILAKTADKITHPTDGKRGKYDRKGHSQFYGYGRLNAEKALILAQEKLRNTE